MVTEAGLEPAQQGFLKTPPRPMQLLGIVNMGVQLGDR